MSVIHSDLDMHHRTLIMKNFREGVTRILVSTDLLARGIDVQQCNVVINYELPDSAETYVHRVGRTGRGGASGQAITLVSPAQQSEWEAIERAVRADAED